MTTTETPLESLKDIDASKSVPSGYEQTELGVIPDDWEPVPLSDLFTFKNGLNKAKRFFGFGTPIVNYMDVFGRPGLRMEDLTGRVSLSPQEVRNYQVRKGDVFFTRTSETVEEIGVASVMLDEPCDTVFSGFVLRARPSGNRLEDTFKKYCFAPLVVRTQIMSKSTYTTRALTNGRSLSAVSIMVPPRPEQRAIAEALSDVDRLIEALQKLIAKKRGIEQATMQQLLNGKTRLPGFSEEWETKGLGEECELVTKGTTPTSLGRKFTEQGVNFVKVESLTADGNPIWDRMAAVDEETHRLLKRSQIKENDILFSIAGALGRTAIVKQSWLPANTNQALAIIRLKSGSCLNHAFLVKYLRGPQMVAHVRATSVQAAQANLSLTDVNNFEIIVPPSKEQHAIASVLSSMDGEIAALEQCRDKTEAIKQGMMQQLLTGRVRLVNPAEAEAAR